MAAEPQGNSNETDTKSSDIFTALDAWSRKQIQKENLAWLGLGHEQVDVGDSRPYHYTTRLTISESNLSLTDASRQNLSRKQSFGTLSELPPTNPVATAKPARSRALSPPRLRRTRSSISLKDTKGKQKDIGAVKHINQDLFSRPRSLTGMQVRVKRTFLERALVPNALDVYEGEMVKITKDLEGLRWIQVEKVYPDGKAERGDVPQGHLDLDFMES